jgi:hypothetical protein
VVVLFLQSNLSTHGYFCNPVHAPCLYFLMMMLHQW